MPGRAVPCRPISAVSPLTFNHIRPLGPGGRVSVTRSHGRTLPLGNSPVDTRILDGRTYRRLRNRAATGRAGPDRALVTALAQGRVQLRGRLVILLVPSRSNCRRLTIPA